MKLGDLVKYDSTRYEGYANYPGVVIKRYTQIPYTPGLSDREMVDVLFPYGVVSDDSYEFEVVNEAR